MILRMEIPSQLFNPNMDTGNLPLPIPTENSDIDTMNYTLDDVKVSNFIET